MVPGAKAETGWRVEERGSESRSRHSWRSCKVNQKLQIKGFSGEEYIAYFCIYFPYACECMCMCGGMCMYVCLVPDCFLSINEPGDTFLR